MNATKRLTLPLVLVFLLAVPFLVTSQYNMHLIVMAGIYTVMAEGLNLILGYAGDLSLGQHAFYGVGAYTTALLFTKLGMSFWVGVLAAIAVTSLLGLALGYLSLRVRGGAFIIMTMSFASIAYLVALNWTKVTNGQMGLASIAPPRLFGFVFGDQKSFYYLVLAFAAAAVFLVDRLVHSKIGRAWIAIRENEILASSLGIGSFRYSMIAFVIGAGLAGISGTLYAHYARFISPELIAFHQTITLLVMVVLGGKGTVYGPVVGAVIFTVLPEYLRVADELRLPIFGLLLILLVLFIPKGLLPAIQDVTARLRTGAGVRGKGVKQV